MNENSKIGTEWAPKGYRDDEIRLKNTNRTTSEGNLVCLAMVDRALDDPRGPPGLHTLLVVDGIVHKEYEIESTQEHSLLRRAFRQITSANNPVPLERVLLELDNMYCGFDYRM